jgi:hypothetical protein
MSTINHWTRRRSEGRCAYCAQLSVTVIPIAGFDHVCTTHALEFWHGLMAYAKNRHLESDPDAVGRLPEWAVHLQPDYRGVCTRSFPLRAERNGTAA